MTQNSEFLKMGLKNDRVKLGWKGWGDREWARSGDGALLKIHYKHMRNSQTIKNG